MRFESPWKDLFEEEKPEKKKKPRKKSRYYRFELQCDPVTDKKIIKQMEKQPNRAEYIRRLIAEDIKHERNHRRYLREKERKKEAVD